MPASGPAKRSTRKSMNKRTLTPRLYAPVSTLRVLPRGSVPRMTRGQCGSLLLHCNGLSPSTSCRSSRRTAAQYLARGLPCERFTAALASRNSCITRGRGGWLDLPRGGLAPPILCSWRTLWQVEQGNRDQAQYHLNRIAALAGTDSEEYRSLAAALEKPPGTGMVY